jgi:predicted transposase YdaD
LLDDRHDLPTRSIVILLRPQADGDDLTGVYRRSLPGGPNFLEFRYDVIRVWEQPVEPLLNGGLGTLPMALVADLGELDPPEVVRRLADRIDREPKEDAALLWSATAILMGLRFGRDEITQLLRGVRDMKESVFYQMILEEGEAKGEAKGKIKGKIEGKIEEAQRILLFIGSDRWGEPDPAVIEMVESLGDLGRVEALIKKSNRSSSWEELLAEPLPDQAGS